MNSNIIPILCIFDYRKMTEFYVDWLDFTIDWEHRFEEDSPVYLQVTKGDITLRLSEHHGDGCPDARLRIQTTRVTDYNKQLGEKKHKYNKPGLNEDWTGGPCFTVLDPFGEQLTFFEMKQ